MKINFKSPVYIKAPHFMKYRAFIFSLMILISCNQNKLKPENHSGQISHHTDTVPSLNNKAEIPQKVKEYLQAYLPGWQVPDTSEYPEFWWTFYDKDMVTYYVTTDLNDDKKSDYAFTLKSNDSLKLVFVLQDGDSLTHYFPHDFSMPYDGKGLRYGIKIEPPGRTDRVVDNKDRSLILKTNGIALMKDEMMIKIYYWENNQLKTFNAK